MPIQQFATDPFFVFLDPFDPDAKTRGRQREQVWKWFLETDPVYRTNSRRSDFGVSRLDAEDRVCIDLVAEAKVVV